MMMAPVVIVPVPMPVPPRVMIARIGSETGVEQIGTKAWIVRQVVMIPREGAVEMVRTDVPMVHAGEAAVV